MKHDVNIRAQNKTSERCLTTRWIKLLNWCTLWVWGQRRFLWDVTQLFKRKYCFHLQNTLKRRNGVISMKTALRFFTVVNILNLVRDWQRTSTVVSTRWPDLWLLLLLLCITDLKYNKDKGLIISKQILNRIISLSQPVSNHCLSCSQY